MWRIALAEPLCYRENMCSFKRIGIPSLATIVLLITHAAGAGPAPQTPDDRMLGAAPAVAPAKAEQPAPLPPPHDLGLNTSEDIKLYRLRGHRSPKWNELIVPAFQTFDGGNFPTAFVFLQKAYERGCRDPLVLFRLGLYRESTGALKEAASLFEEAAKKLPEHYPKHHLTKDINAHAARVLYQLDRTDAAMKHIRRALKETPDDFMMLFLGGQILRQQKQPREARILLERAIAVPIPAGMNEQQTKRTLYNELVAVCYELGNFDSSLKYADEVFRIDPNDPVARNYAQKIQRELQRRREREIINRLVQ